MSVFSDRISEARRRKGVSRQEAANSLGISNQTVSRYENGTQEPSFETFIKLAIYYGVSTDWLLNRSEKDENT